VTRRPSRVLAPLWAAASVLATLDAGAAERDEGRTSRLLAGITTLSADAWQGRRAGTAGADRAADWIAAQFQAAGLEPGGDAGYDQRFVFIDGAKLGEANRLTAAGRRYRVTKDFQPLALSTRGEAAGPIVFAGYGIVAPDLSYDDYAGLDVRGKVVLVLRHGPRWGTGDSPWERFLGLRRKALTAHRQGAAALLITTGPETPTGDELVPFSIDAALGDAGLPVLSIKRDVAKHLFYGSGRSLSAAQQRIDETGKPASMRLAMSASLEADVHPTRAVTQNVIGVMRVPGAEESLVIGAHYDHLGRGGPGSMSEDDSVHHGADDNASGTAALIELARSLAPRTRSLKRNIVFIAFGAEEFGLLGSAHFVKHPTFPLDTAVAMANLDMIGRLGPNALGVFGVGTSPVWRDFVETANENLGLPLTLHDTGYGPSDHASFFAAGKPVLFFFTGLHSDYHRPTDTADKIDVVGVGRIVSLAEQLLAALATSEAPIPFVDPAGVTW